MHVPAGGLGALRSVPQRVPNRTGIPPPLHQLGACSRGSCRAIPDARGGIHRWSWLPPRPTVDTALNRSCHLSELHLIAEGVIAGTADAVDRLVRAELDRGLPAEEILEQGLIAGMTVVGRRFRDNEIFVPEVLLAARAMRAGLAPLEPVFAACGVPSAGTCVLGTVQGDIHDIGKNLVGVMLRGAGFTVVDIGINVPAAKFVAAAREHRADIVGLSALLTTTMTRMKEVIAALRAAGLPCRVLVGGAAVTPEFARLVGADAYAANASEAVDAARRCFGSPTAEAAPG